jgi:murein DD-endopeptidase MepM/ murein hydrolase activator NlpD
MVDRFIKSGTFSTKSLLFIFRRGEERVHCRKITLSILGLIFLGIFTATCSNQSEYHSGTNVPIRIQVDTSTPNSRPILTVTPASTRTSLVLDELQVTVSLPPTNTPEIFKMCSPLEMEMIADLFEIVSDPYKPPPVNRSEERHHGVDFSHYARKGMKSIENEKVHSITDGRVTAAIVDRLPYGNMVVIESPYDHFPVDFAREIGLVPGSSLYFLYAHLANPPEVALREEVECGQTLGAVGKTGYNIVNPHLHLEIRIGPQDVTFNGMAFYTTTASIEEMDNYVRWRTGGEFQHLDPMDIFSRFLTWNNSPP